MEKLLTHFIGFRLVNRLINKLIGHYVTIYMIHRSVAKDGSYQGLSPELLEQCLIYAKQNGFEFASLDEVIHNATHGIKPKKPTLCFTLDDGFDDQVSELVPVLLKHNAKPTIFILTDFVDGINWPWDSRLSYIVWNTTCVSGSICYKNVQFDFNFKSQQDKLKTRRALVKYAKKLPSDELDDFIAAVSHEFHMQTPASAPEVHKAVTWDKLRHYENLGLRIGSHARSHRVFSSLTSAEVKQEILHAKSRLSEELKSPSQVFCYPSGTADDYHSTHAELVKKLGYLAAVSANPGNTTNALIKEDLYNIKRHSFPNSLERFARYSSWIEVIRSKLTLSITMLFISSMHLIEDSITPNLCLYL